MRPRTSWLVPAAHCQIAVTQSLPTTSVAHAANTKITTSGCRRPRGSRGSGTSASRIASDDARSCGSAASSASHNARSASRADQLGPGAARTADRKASDDRKQDLAAKMRERALGKQKADEEDKAS